MMKKIHSNILLGTLLATVLLVATAPTLSLLDNISAAKPDKPGKPEKQEQKPKKCQVKVQVKILNAQNGTTYIAQLGNLPAQSKIAEESNGEALAFNFQYKKGGDSCPAKGDIVQGQINGEPFSLTINSLTKPNKIGIDLLGDDSTTIPPTPTPIITTSPFKLFEEVYADNPGDDDNGYGNDPGKSGDAHKKNDKRDRD